MDSSESIPITLKDLRNELHEFAEVRLVHVLRAALKDCRGGDLETHDIQSRSGLSDSFEQTLTEISRTSPSSRSRKLTRAYMAVPSERETISTKSSWKTPSLKYQAAVQARSRRSSIRGRVCVSHQSDQPDLQQESTAPLIGTTLQSADEKDSQRDLPLLHVIVESALFEQLSLLLVLLNSIYMGYDTNYIATHPGVEDPVVRVLEPTFCLIFTAELLLRIAVFGWGFYTMQGWEVNLFDTLLVAFQVIEQALLFFAKQQTFNLSILKAGRLLRFVRFARLFRVFHLFDELRVIVTSMLDSLSSLAWSMVLFAMLIYVFALVFLQCISTAGHTQHYEELHPYFSSVFRACLTMFQCVVGGVDWDNVVRPIISDISPVLAIVFCCYVSACLFAMMNILTGIFVDKATSRVREDKDYVLAKRVREVFFPSENAESEPIGDTEITWEEFEEKLDSPAMQDYFEQIHINPSEAHALFDLMDEDGSGSLNPNEIVKGCLRLRGPARALDLSVLTRDVLDVFERVCNVEQGIKRLLLVAYNRSNGRVKQPHQSFSL